MIHFRKASQHLSLLFLKQEQILEFILVFSLASQFFQQACLSLSSWAKKEKKLFLDCFICAMMLIQSVQ